MSGQAKFACSIAFGVDGYFSMFARSQTYPPRAMGVGMEHGRVVFPPLHLDGQHAVAR